MVGRAGWWTWTTSTTLLQPKKWNAHFCITFNFWWLAGLVIGLEPHPPPLSSQKNEMLIFGLRLTSDDQPGWLINLNPICHPCPAKKMKCSFLDYVQLLIVAWAGQWTQMPSTTCLQPRNEMLIFELRSTSDDWPGWSMDSNPIHHPYPAKKMKCLFLDYVQLLMISQTGQWTRTPSATPLLPRKWNACFWIMFNFWWSAGLVNGFKPHPSPISSQKNEMLIFGLLSISGDQPGWSMDSNPIHNPLSSQENEMLIFGLHSTSDDWLGWSMDSNLIHHPSPGKKMICSFLDYIQLLMIGWMGRWTRTPSGTPLQPKKWNAYFCIMFNFWWSAGLVDGLKPHLSPLSNQKNEMLVFVLCSTSDDQLGWSMDSNPICHPSQATKMKCSFLYYIQLLMIGRAGHRTQTPSTSPLKPKKWNAHFWITFNFWWSARLVNGLKPHPPPLCRHKMKCLFLHYVQLVMIGQAGHWTPTPSATPLQPKKWNACFCITLYFWWSAGLVDGLKAHPPPLSSQKMKCSFLDYV